MLLRKTLANKFIFFMLLTIALRGGVLEVKEAAFISTCGRVRRCSCLSSFYM